MRFEVGDFVNYKKSGICEIMEIKKADFGQGKKEYYFLRSAYDTNTRIRIPVDSPAVKTNMRRLLTQEEIDSIILKTENSENEWQNDYKKRSAAFEAILDTGERSDILWMIKVLSLYKKEALETNKKFGVTDEKLLERAEKAIVQEFSFILDIPQEEVIPYIIDKVEKSRYEKA